jgi:hypothetical protein
VRVDGQGMDRFEMHAELDAILTDCVDEAREGLRDAIGRGDLAHVRSFARDLALAAEGLHDMAAGTFRY